MTRSVFSRERAGGYTQVIIAKSGKPVARLVPIEPPRGPRVPGSAKGQIWIADDFDAPLADAALDDFEKGPIFPK